MKKVEWKHLSKYLMLSTGKKNPDVWWYIEKNHISIWTSNGCLGRIYFSKLKRVLKEASQ